MVVANRPRPLISTVRPDGLTDSSTSSTNKKENLICKAKKSAKNQGR
jgi:hypothetical protein